MTKDLVLEHLLAHADEFISGENIASSLSLSRTAVWKAMEQLRSEGYPIESVTNRGYRLSSDCDVLSEAGVRKYLNCNLKLQVFPVVDSTNTVIKKLAEEGGPEGSVALAMQQTAGRGRMGRSFYSPSGSGLYMSLLLRPSLPAASAGLITSAAAVAVADAVDALSGRETKIKWVNDILLDGKKICGILTEGAVDCETGLLKYAVLGIGINVKAPEGGYPEEIRAVAGPAFGEEHIPALRCRLAAEVLNRFMAYYADLTGIPFYEAYRKRSIVLGRRVQLIAPGRETEEAEVLDVDKDFALLVRMPSGEERRVNSGEISIRPEEGKW